MDQQEEEALFHDAVKGLERGDFSRLDPLFVLDETLGNRSQIVSWIAAGRFENEPAALNEALTCACFNGRIEVAEFILGRGIDASGGNGTGLNAIHWAANRGQLGAVNLLLQHSAPLEFRNMYGGTVLSATVWAAVNETKPNHPEIVEALLKAGADVGQAEYPSGDERIDRLLQQYGAR